MTKNVIEMENKLNSNPRNLLGDNKSNELTNILALGEEYKKKGEELKRKFWEDYNKGFYNRLNYINLMMHYEKNKEIVLSLLLEDELKEIIENMDGIIKEKFINEYLKERIFFRTDPRVHPPYKNIIQNDGYFDIDRAKKVVDGLEALGKLENSYINLQLKEIDIEDQDLEYLLKEISKNMKPGMIINFYKSSGFIGGSSLFAKYLNNFKEGVNINLFGIRLEDSGFTEIVKSRKNKLQPCMDLGFGRTRIEEKGAEVLAKERKKSLKEGLRINLHDNNIGDNGLEYLSEEWADELKEGMELDFSRNNITDKGIETMINKLKLKEGDIIKLNFNDISISMKERVKDRVQSYRDKGINCFVLI